VAMDSRQSPRFVARKGSYPSSPTQIALEFLAVETVYECEVYVKIEFSFTARPIRQFSYLKQELVDIVAYARLCVHIGKLPSDRTVDVKQLSAF